MTNKAAGGEEGKARMGGGDMRRRGLYLTHLFGFNTPSHFPLYRLNARALVLGSGCCTGSYRFDLGSAGAGYSRGRK